MTILVTGASGGFGSAFLPMLRADTEELVIASGKNESTCLSYMKCDFTDEAAVRKLISSIKPRLIYHLVGSFTGQFEQDFKVNVLSSKYIFDSVLADNLGSRVVLFGSAAEYGAVLASDNPLSESHPCCPVSIYGLTKYFQTDMAQFYFRTKLIDVVVARVFNIAAKGLSERLFYGRAEKLIQRYKAGDVQYLEFGCLGSERDYIELDQLKEQILAVAKYGISGEIYNVGSGIPQKMRTVLDGLLEREGIVNVNVIETSSELIGRKGIDVPVIYADITKVSNLLHCS